MKEICRIVKLSVYFSALAALLILFSSPSPAQGQNSPIDPVLAVRYFDEATDLCRRDDGKLWGVSLCAPLLFVDRTTRAVVANQADRENILNKNGDIFTGQLPGSVNIANTTTGWAGVKWTMIIFPLPEERFARRFHSEARF